MSQGKMAGYWQKIRTKKISLIGIVLFAVGLFILLPLYFILTNTLKEPYEKYDHDEIVAKGNPGRGKITGVFVKQNVTFNGDHPRLITYQYLQGDAIVTDQFQTIDRTGYMGISKDDSIDIFILNDQSVIKNMRPFSFPSLGFLGLPVMLIVFGVILFVIGQRVRLGNWNY